MIQGPEQQGVIGKVWAFLPGVQEAKQMKRELDKVAAQSFPQGRAIKNQRTQV